MAAWQTIYIRGGKWLLDDFFRGAEGKVRRSKVELAALLA